MAWDAPTQKISLVAGSTFAATDLYKAISVDSAGFAVLASAAGTTDPEVVGTLYSYTGTTSTESNAVTVAVGPILKGYMGASTAAQGNIVVGATSDGSFIAGGPSTQTYSGFLVIDGSSGSAGRIATLLKL